MAADNRHILLVDDSELIIDVMAEALTRKEERYTVLKTTSGEKALQLLAEKDIFLVISDVVMPGISGIELLAAIRNKYPQVGVILMTAHNSEQIKVEAQRGGCLHFLEKPIDLKALKKLIDAQLKDAQDDKGFAGTLKCIDLIDLIQMCCLSSISVAIRIMEEHETGTIYIDSGQIVHATTASSTGEEAFYEILSWQTGRFETLGGGPAPERTIQNHYQHLLMEAARKSDEIAARQADGAQACAAPVEDQPARVPPDETETDGPLEEKPDDAQLLTLQEIVSDDQDDTDAQPEDANEPNLYELASEIFSKPESKNGMADLGIEDPKFFEIDTQADFADRTLRVLVVDDSGTMCRILSDIINSDDRLEVVGTAKNGEEALKQISDLNPDLITLDVNMPVMDGGTALKHIMIRTPCPVVIISNPGDYGRSKILDFLRLGAVDFIGKPSRSADMDLQKQQIIEALHQAAQAQLNCFSRGKALAEITARDKPLLPLKPKTRLVLINSGAGGFAELFKIIPALPAAMPGIVIVWQSMPTGFDQILADFLDARSRIAVKAIENKIQLQPGCCYIAGDAAPLTLYKSNGRLHVRQSGDPGSNGHRKGFSHLVKSIPVGFDDQYLALFLSGARIKDPQQVVRHLDQGNRLLLQSPKTALIPKPLHALLEANQSVQTASPVQLAKRIQKFVNRPM